MPKTKRARKAKAKPEIKLTQPDLTPGLVQADPKDPDRVKSIVRYLVKAQFEGTGHRGKFCVISPDLLERVRKIANQRLSMQAVIVRLKKWDVLEQVEAITKSGLLLRGKPNVHACKPLLDCDLSVATRMFPELVQE